VFQLNSDVAYAKGLVAAGLNGITCARKEIVDRKLMARVTDTGLYPIAIGVASGVLLAYLRKNRRSGYTLAAGALLGGALAYTGGVAWASRRAQGTVVRNVLRNVNAARDAHWLERNPIAYA